MPATGAERFASTGIQQRSSSRSRIEQDWNGQDRSTHSSITAETLFLIVSDLLSKKTGDLGQQIFEPPDLLFCEVRTLLPEHIVNWPRTTGPKELNCLGIDPHEDASTICFIALRGHDPRLLHRGNDAGDETLGQSRPIGNLPDCCQWMMGDILDDRQLSRGDAILTFVSDDLQCDLPKSP